jgi:hypothetical protein
MREAGGIRVTGEGNVMKEAEVVNGCISESKLRNTDSH